MKTFFQFHCKIRPQMDIYGQNDRKECCLWDMRMRAGVHPELSDGFSVAFTVVSPVTGRKDLFMKVNGRVCKDEVNLDLLGAGFDFDGARIRAMAGTTGSSAKVPCAAIRLEYEGENQDLEWLVRNDGCGVEFAARGDDAVLMLKELIAHLYQIVVEEKVNIEDVYRYHKFKKSEKEKKDYE